MKNSHFIYVLAAATLPVACAAPQTTPWPAAGPPLSAYYCARERLVQNGDRLDCNWQATADEACRIGKSSVLKQSLLASEPQPAGRCDSGVSLVKVSPR